MITEEIRNAIVAAGITPDLNSTTQLRDAILALVAAGVTNDFKASVRVATTANIASLDGGAPNTLDGITLAANDRILVKNQTTASQNGIYYVSTLGTGSNGTWTRATDADGAGELTSGAMVAVEVGTANADSLWMLTTDGTITIGTTSLTFARQNSASQSSTSGLSATIFTSSGTFTIPAGVTKLKVTVVGGGGNGGVATDEGGSGGGGGGAAISYLSGLTPGNNLSVTVGAASSSSSVASGSQSISTVSATGGVNGANSGGVAVAGGIGSGGNINLAGGHGLGSSTFSGVGQFGGQGGSSVFAGSVAPTTANQMAGPAARSFGGGGAGGITLSSGGTGTGGAGFGGVVIFEYIL